jgi:hypothetical protein
MRLIEALARGEAAALESTFARAVLGGAQARGVAGAFSAGYQAALRALVPELPEGQPACLCATEAGGAHPRAIQARLEPDGDGFRLSGHKKWVTGAPLAGVYLVVASTGQGADGRNALRVARVDARAPGITLTPLPEASFVPELPHAEVTFERTPVEALLPGDGYERYLKPFRTIEDCHVFGAVLGYLAQVARRSGWPRGFEERLYAVLGALAQVAAADPSDRATHLLLAGALDLGRRVADESAPLWEQVQGQAQEQVQGQAQVDPAERAAWERDVALLSVAGRARAARAESAWRALRG